MSVKSSTLRHESSRPITSFVCPVIIGRTHELDVINEHLHGSGPPVLLLSGEAGIGKSRLLAEAKRWASERLTAVLQGNCHERDSVLPYAALVDLVRSIQTMRSRKDMDDPNIGDELAELTGVLPNPPLHGSASATPESGDPEQHKRRIQYALVDLIAGQAATSPLLLVVEDLHWSDESTLECLAYLARHTADYPIRLMFSYRSDEPHPSLPHYIADLERERLAVELGLAPLTRDELDAVVRAIFGPDHPFPVGVLDTVYRLTEGNPFFVEETLKSLVELGDLVLVDETWNLGSLATLRVPRTVQDAVQRRVAGLSEPARELLAFAAVTGQRFDFALLQSLTGRDEEELLGLIKQLMTHQLVVEESADRFAFRHALTREAIYADLLARERRRIHRMVAETMEDLSRAGTFAGDPSYHFYAGEVWDKALEYCSLAGEHALALYAPHAAVESFSHALDAADRLPGTASAEMFRGRGTAHELLGDFESALTDYEAAREQARRAGDRPGECQALLDLALLWSSRDYLIVGDFVQAALSIAREGGDQVLLACSLNRLGNWYTNVERPRKGMECHQEALAIFERLEDRRGIAETLDFLGMTSNIADDHVRSADHYSRAIPLLEEVNDRQRLVISLTMLMLQSGLYFTETARCAPLAEAEAIAYSERALEIARSADWPAGLAFVLYETALWLGPRGHFDRALRSAHAALSTAEEIGHYQWMAGALCALGVLHLDLLNASEAQRFLERALTVARESSSVLWERVATAYLVPAYLALGRVEQASILAGGAMEPDAPMESIMQRLCWRARAQLALARADAELALEIVDRLVGSAAAAPGQTVIPELWKLRGEALIRLGCTLEAELTFQEALNAGVSQGLRPLLWRVHLSLGKLLQGEGRRKEAWESFRAARALVEELAGGISGDAHRSAFLQRTNALLPALRPASPKRAAQERFGGLTTREREVAVRIARGKSNRVIAEDLVVTERTVEGYVGNILAKLDFSSRAQIAAWTVEHGLIRGTE